MEDTLFTKIIKGQIPSYKIYEDDKTYAFLDIHPINDGHVLVVPKNPVEFIWDLPAEDYEALMATVQKIGNHLKQNSGQSFVGVQVVGVDVPHAHVHVIPFNNAHELHKDVDFSDEVDHRRLEKNHQKLRIQ